VPLSRVLPGQPLDQLAHLIGDRRAPGGIRVGPSVLDEAPVPGEQDAGVLLATSLFGDVTAALREHGSATPRSPRDRAADGRRHPMHAPDDSTTPSRSVTVMRRLSRHCRGCAHGRFRNLK
jgi:hypothetical protein